jgi:hypothetical protein
VRSRSAQSLLFEEVVRGATTPGDVPRLADLEFTRLSELAPWIAAVDPDHATFALKIVRAGEGVCNMLGRDLVGLDYLDFVDPAIKGEAFDSAFVMLSRPCGLWQITPALTEEGKTIVAEYTGFPVFDEERGRGLIVNIVHHTFSPVPRVAKVLHATEWTWLELRGGSALL